MRHAVLLALLVAGGVSAPAEAAAMGAASCAGDDRYALLDFWVGEWSVRVEGREVGTNRIRKVLEGCAVLEEWRDGRGGAGMSLFYVDPTGVWKQVWVTDAAARPGGTKEKRLVERSADGSVLFQGELPAPGGGTYLDRTRLTPLAAGRVRQRIEVSRDGGATWEARFDAVYEPAGGAAEGGSR